MSSALRVFKIQEKSWDSVCWRVLFKNFHSKPLFGNLPGRHISLPHHICFTVKFQSYRINYFSKRKIERNLWIFKLKSIFSRRPIDSSGGINRKSHKNSNFRKVTLMPNKQARKKKEVTFFQRKICKAKIKGDYYEIGVYFFEKIKDSGQ